MHSLTTLICLVGISFAGEAIKIETSENGMEVKLTREQCQKLITNHKPRSGVNYKPGESVNGKPVVPADISPLIKVPNLDLRLKIQLSDLLPQYGLTFSSSLNPVINDSEIGLGHLKIDDDGKITYNNQPLGDPVQDKIAEQCRKQYKIS